MVEYYLISQLPSLDGISEASPMPIDEERFFELCSRHLGKRAQNEIKKLTLAPQLNSERPSSGLLEQWYEAEQNLRLALGKARAGKMNKSFELQNTSFSSELVKVAGEAVEIENPMEAEKFLFNYRLNLLETLRPMDTFSGDFIFYYGLKLKLIMRMRQFDEKAGESAYRNIYNSILNGDRMEAVK